MWNVEKRRKMGRHFETDQGGFRQICSFLWAENCWKLSQSKKNLEVMMEELVDEVGKCEMEPKTTSMRQVPTRTRRRKVPTKPGGGTF